MGVTWLSCILRRKKLSVRKPVHKMSEEEYAKYMLSLDRRIAFWGVMYDLHPIPLILLILIAWAAGSCLGWCK